MNDAAVTTTADAPAVFSLAAILDHVGEAVSIFDKEWRMLYSNEAALNMGKTTQEKVYGKVFWDVFCDLAGTIYEEYYRRAMQEQVDLTFEFYYPTIERWIETRLYPTPETLTVFTLDITERKQASEAVRKEQERLQNTLNAAGIGTWRWDFTTDLYTADVLTMRFMDVKPEQLAPNDDSLYRKRIHPDDLAAVDEALIRTAELGEPYDHTYRLIHTDGSIHWIEGRGHLEFDSTGKAIALIGTAMDITEFKNTQEAVRQSEDKYRRLIDGLDQGYALCEMIWDADKRPVDFRFLEGNRTFLANAASKSSIGRTAQEVSPGLEEAWMQQYAKVLRTGEAIRFEQDSEHLGKIFDVFAFPVDANRFIMLFTDITTRRHQDRDMMRLNERLRRAMQETHHRVKNNLQVITALVEMQAADMNNEAAAPLNRINQHVQALAVIHDLLTQQARTDADMEHIGAQTILDTLLPHLQSTIGERILTADTENVTLTVLKAASFALLVSECVSNAVKHGQGKIEITLKHCGTAARLEVRDNGEGFPPDFDPRTAANTGLQLIESTARWDLGGTVTYDNHPKGGGRVTVTFPLETGQRG